MYKLCVPMLLLLLATACDSPQRNRMSVNTGNGLSQPNGGTGTNPWGTSGTSGTTGTGGGTTGGAGQPAKPPGFDNCDISPKYYAAGINYMGICQSTLDETSVAVNSTVSDTARTCLIPTFKEQNGSSTYIGIPQCFEPEAGKVTMGQLPKNRTGYYQGNVKFVDLSLNGVMVMKEASKDAYFECMHAYLDYRSGACPQGPANPYCSQQANIYMASKCNAFKANNSYIDIRLKN